MSENNEMILRAKLAMKLATVSNKMVNMAKDGQNTMQKFNYISYENINAHLSKYMFDVKMMIIPEIIKLEKTTSQSKKGQTIITVLIEMSFDIIDAETGYMITKKFQGESSDYNDKAVPKASTEVQKRFYAKLFNITSGEIDGDKETVESGSQNKGSKNNNNSVKREVPKIQKEVDAWVGSKKKRVDIINNKLSDWGYNSLADIKGNEVEDFLRQIKELD